MQAAAQYRSAVEGRPTIIWAGAGSQTNKNQSIKQVGTQAKAAVLISNAHDQKQSSVPLRPRAESARVHLAGRQSPNTPSSVVVGPCAAQGAVNHTTTCCQPGSA